jgi:hypothetical protein
VDIKIHVTKNIRFSHTIVLLFMAYLSVLSATQLSVLNGRMIGKDVERSSHNLI